MGIKLRPAVVESFLSRYVLCRSSLSGVKWEKDDNLHITLRFIGEISVESRESLALSLASSVNVNSFVSSIVHFGTFPVKGVPRVIQCCLQENMDMFQLLQSSIDQCIEDCGIELGKKETEFVPHVTVARNRSAKRREVQLWIDSLSSVEPIPLIIDEYHLIRSSLTSSGAHYEVLQSYSLQDKL